MTSAVPYEPDDFDNNPFAESSVIFQPPEQGSSEPEEPQEQSSTLSGNEEASQSQQPRELDSPFNHKPTDEDLKRYLPERLNKSSFQLAIKVVEIGNRGSEMAKNPVFVLAASVQNIPGFRKSTYKDVRRSYKELEALYRYLIYNNIEVFVPAFPVIPTIYNVGSPEFVSTLHKSVQVWFNRVCSNPILIRNQEFTLFLDQNDFSYTPSKTKPNSSSVMATGFKRRTLKQFQPPYDASQELASYRPMIKSIYLASQKIVEKLDKLLRLQKSSCNVNADFYNKLAGFQELEESSEMSKMWVKLNKVLQLYNEMDLVEGVGLSANLTDLFQLLTDDCYNIKESLTNRHLLMRELLNAEDNTKKRHSTIARLKTKSIIDPVKVDEAIRALELASNYEKELKYQVKRTTYEMLLEADEFLVYLTGVARKTFKMIAQQQIQQQRKKLHLLDTNKLIHPTESLSRLGRESMVQNSKNESGSRDSSDPWNSRPKKKFETEIAEPLSADSSLKDDTNDQLARVDAKSAASLLANSSF
ncbi:hypothetical protein OGAPHI_007390 [Ogataea philodendri]|uniref:PX domain-containing protein n=1 Tax=Ogataea philodendri TaxID=1378263 RepID=A0A9P8SZS2_9ASCO|nr:uncharacterized protein OGAPHI_007390 [Ogataea philodendri]KAH3660185.1 hypothetical protein OGAPHI_007390 [Ogataea philodendri]